MRKPFDLSLYLVTDREFSLGRAVSEIVEKAVRGGVSMVQLREKEITTRDFLSLAVELKSLLKRSGIPLIINDRIDIALAINADGVHVGQNDMPVEMIRKIMGNDVLIGLSVESISDAEAANTLDIDYIGISPVFATSTKKELVSGLGIDGVRGIVKVSKFPAVGIGGINYSNTEDIITAGADGVAVVSAICSADDPEYAASALSVKVSSARCERVVK
jgi:thiamine-phosphate pyrophosphorylase